MFKRFILPLTVDMLFIYVCPSLIDAVGAHVYPRAGICANQRLSRIALPYIAVTLRAGNGCRRRTKAP